MLFGILGRCYPIAEITKSFNSNIVAEKQILWKKDKYSVLF